MKCDKRSRVCRLTESNSSVACFGEPSAENPSDGAASPTKTGEMRARVSPDPDGQRFARRVSGAPARPRSGETREESSGAPSTVDYGHQLRCFQLMPLTFGFPLFSEAIQAVHPRLLLTSQCSGGVGGKDK